MDIIVCIDKNNGIGKDGGLLFRIPEDMAYFRRMTVNKTVIMGRKTLESLPGGRPLENRRNIVLTRNRDRVPDGADAVSSIDELKRAIGSDKAFVIGGESIYAMLLDYCERAYVTEDLTFTKTTRSKSFKIKTPLIGQYKPERGVIL